MGSNSSKSCCSKPRKKNEASPEHKEVSQELTALQSDGELPGAACNRLQKADVSLLECHEKDLQSVREEHEQELVQLREDLCSTHNVEKQQLQYQHADYIEKLKQEQQKKEVELSDSRIVELKARHSEYVHVLKRESETALAGKAHSESFQITQIGCKHESSLAVLSIPKQKTYWRSIIVNIYTMLII